MRRMGKLILGMSLLLICPRQGMAHSGHTVWSGWRFDWEVKDNAGLGVRNVYYNDELVIYKASLPVIRVRYDHDACGPYADQINWGSLVNIGDRCGGQKVCQTSYTSGGREWLEVAVYARIGAYHIYQGWYFSHDGWIAPRVWSKGLQCEANHDHHPYWRMDLDVDGAANDQLFVFDSTRPDEGWGFGWHQHTNEFNETKSPPADRKWFVRDHPGGHGVWVLPGTADGPADGFSSKDAAGRRYRYSEDIPWSFGASGHLGYDNGDDVKEKDVIDWYVCHLQHAAAHGGAQWHSCGPWLFVAR